MRRAGQRARFLANVRSVALWTLVWLVLVDVGVGRLFRMPSDPRQEASTLPRFFDYGRSIEAKLRPLVGADSAAAAPIVHAGWIGTHCGPEVPSGRQFDIYGMSFSDHLATQMQVLDPSLEPGRFGGPAAPLNHSYACFLARAQAGAPFAPVQIMSVLASSVRRINTISGLTTSLEGPQPFTYPRYFVSADGTLNAWYPSIDSEEALRAALATPARWQAFLAELQAHDAFYSSFVMRSDPLDGSTIGRMLRRAAAQRIVRDRTDALGAQGGFRGDPSLAPLMGRMLVDFAERCRQRNVRPFVVLIEDRGLGGTLADAVGRQLKEREVEYLATSEVISSEDSQNFERDGHFTPEADRQVANVLNARLGFVHH